MGREEGSGWGTHVYLWWIHFDIWQNQYNIVKFKNKNKKIQKKKEKIQRINISCNVKNVCIQNLLSEQYFTG